MSREGSFVRVYLKNGCIFQGVIQSWSIENGIVLKNMNKEIIEIPFYTEVCAVVSISKPDGTILKESKTIELTPETTPDDSENIKIKSLVELYKMKSESERECARAKLKSQTCTGVAVEYEPTISMLRTLANSSANKSKIKKK